MSTSFQANIRSIWMNLNLGICFTRLGRRGETLRHLQRALELTRNPVLRRKIEFQIRELKKKQQQARNVGGTRGSYSWRPK